MIAPAVPATLGRYRLLSELGRGAMGIVYKAHDTELDRVVAIKTIRMSSDSAELQESLARFRQEAKALGGLSHPHIITVYDLGHDGDIAYMSMELLEGAELRQLIAQSRMPVPLVVEIGLQLADALAFAHERGVVHRDIKPANIMVVGNNHAKLMDFGIARIRASDVKTQTGLLLGSPKYMSPEQILGRHVDHRSDLFSLGVVMYEMLAGSTPFSGADLTQLMYQIMNVVPTPPSRLNPSVPEVLDLIVAKAMEKQPGTRYRNAGELAADLRLCQAAVNDATLRVRVHDTYPLEGKATPARPPPAREGAAERTVRMTPAAPAGPADAVRTLKMQAPEFRALVPNLQFDSRKAIARLLAPSGADRTLLAPMRHRRTGPAPWVRDAELRKAGAVIAMAAVVALWIVWG